jgi:GDP-4-dehydro-6-deoxy-D-mannose reductase
MRAMVTGASGFVGKHLVSRLQAEGYTVSACDREVDVTDSAAVDAYVSEVQPDRILHLAAQSSAANSWKQADLTYRVNYVGTRSVLAAAKNRVPNARVLLVSTADIYGSAPPGARPFDEESPIRPRSPYARTKAAADLLAGCFADRGLDVVRARPFNHTGPGQTDVFVLPSFARQVAAIEAGTAEPLLRVGNLESVRDFLNIEDVIEAYVRLLDPAVPAGVYNIASGQGVKIDTAIRSLCRLADIDPRIEVNPDYFRPTDFSVGNASLLRATTGWEPRIPFQQTLETLLADWRGRVSAS